MRVPPVTCINICSDTCICTCNNNLTEQVSASLNLVTLKMQSSEIQHPKGRQSSIKIGLCCAADDHVSCFSLLNFCVIYNKYILYMIRDTALITIVVHNQEVMFWFRSQAFLDLQGKNWSIALRDIILFTPFCLVSIITPWKLRPPVSNEQDLFAPTLHPSVHFTLTNPFQEQPVTSNAVQSSCGWKVPAGTTNTLHVFLQV